MQPSQEEQRDADKNHPMIAADGKETSSTFCLIRLPFYFFFFLQTHFTGSCWELRGDAVPAIWMLSAFRLPWADLLNNSTPRAWVSQSKRRTTGTYSRCSDLFQEMRMYNRPVKQLLQSVGRKNWLIQHTGYCVGFNLKSTLMEDMLRSLEYNPSAILSRFY